MLQFKVYFFANTLKFQTLILPYIVIPMAGFSESMA